MGSQGAVIGRRVFARFADITPAEFKRVTEVTYLGVVYGTMAALRRMLPRNRGRIIQVGSTLAYRSIPLQSAYCGAKHAIAGFTDSLRTELIHDGKNIQLTMVQLPAMNTPQFNWCRSKLPRHPQPVPPIYQPEVAADVIVWASRRNRREILVGAPTVMAIEGNKIAPGFADKYLGRTGFDSQQTSEPADLDRPDNFFEPLAADFGAHGMSIVSGRVPELHAPRLTAWRAGLSAQRPARDRALTRIPDSPPRRAALCAESVKSPREATARFAQIAR